MNVKLKYVALAVLLSLIGFSYGQNSPDYVLLKKDTVGTITKTIVREYQKNSISYIERGGRHYFTAAIRTQSSTCADCYDSVMLRTVEIDPRCSVNDFKIVNKAYLYFCGNLFDGLNYKGIVGFFKITDLLRNVSLDLNIHDNFEYHDQNARDIVVNLNKIELLYSRDRFRAITIGETKSTRSCILELTMSDMGEQIGSYSVGVLNQIEERLNDIAVDLNEYVVTVGSIYNEGNASIRRFSRNSSIFLDSALLNVVDTYPTNESVDSNINFVIENTKSIQITPLLELQEDIVAIASYWYNPSIPSLGDDLQGVLLRFFNLTTPGSPVMIASMSIDQNYYNGGWELKELDYNPILQTFTLLQDMEVSPTSRVSLVSAISFPGNTPTIQSSGYSDIEFTSFDEIPGTRHNVISGYAKSVPTYFILAGDKINSSYTCDGSSVNQTITQKNTYWSKRYNEGMKVSTDVLSFNPQTCSNISSTYMVLSCQY